MKLSALKLALLSASMATGVLATQAHAKPITEADRAQILKAVDADAPQIQDAALKIWGFAEVGYQEVKSSALLQGQLKTAGFDVKAGVAAFFAGAVGLLALAIWLLRPDPVALLALLPAAVHFTWQVLTLDPEDGGNALARFRSNRFAGLLVAAACFVAGNA